jgi:hypothetical protein
MKEKSAWYRYGYLWITLIFFTISILGHWIFGWYAFVNEQTEHGQPIIVSEYIIEVGRDTLENWQSEFLQLMWQVAGLAYFLYIGSPQSKEGDERKEEKLDEILKKIDLKDGARIVAKLDEKYPRT